MFQVTWLGPPWLRHVPYYFVYFSIYAEAEFYELLLFQILINACSSSQQTIK